MAKLKTILATNDYDLLIICYKSGQIPEDEWQEILKDEVFYCYYQKQIRS